ncbi:hypothetical protein AWB68_06038 [Caballeronia choica]|uniref:Uncharacterized protein n=1 Tax=Caballeronia choica TaxID=326476 RepID=A0A158KJ12_9BURK|nr:hypothetical protein [Caballeronia choica]SAL81132.1 hypothetical protein AWB68_06038 [Caballeronia choica]
MRNLLTRTLLTMVSADERSFRLARRTRTRLATFDKAHRRYDSMIVAGVILLALTPVSTIIVAWFLNLRGLL